MHAVTLAHLELLGRGLVLLGRVAAAVVVLVAVGHVVRLGRLVEAAGDLQVVGSRSRILTNKSIEGLPLNHVCNASYCTESS